MRGENEPRILDASVVIAWAAPDEFEPLADKVMLLAGQIGAVVPGIWNYEVSNILVMCERRGRMSESELTQIIEDLGASAHSF